MASSPLATVGSLRIALLHPTYWPEVRRGSERLMHDLGATLAARGHDVTIMTSHPGPTTTSIEDGIRVVRARRPPELRLQRKYEHHLGHVPGVIWRLARGRFDLAHAFFIADAWAALRARRLGGPPVVFSFHGIPIREYLVGRRYRLEMMRAAVTEADAVSVLSAATVERFRRYLLVEPRVLPGGVMPQWFNAEATRAPQPTVICAASLGDPYKRAATLFAGFERLRRGRPDARLVLVRSRDPHESFVLPELPAGTEVIEADATEELARAYAAAWVSVLPSLDEAFGLVLLESLAAGTPVVATRSGGLPEIVTSDRIGRLFAPDDPEDLARALDQALDLAIDPGTAEACRERAAEFEWGRVAERYEEVYREVLEAAP